VVLYLTTYRITTVPGFSQTNFAQIFPWGHFSDFCSEHVDFEIIKRLFLFSVLFSFSHQLSNLKQRCPILLENNCLRNILALIFGKCEMQSKVSQIVWLGKYVCENLFFFFFFFKFFFNKMFLTANNDTITIVTGQIIYRRIPFLNTKKIRLNFKLNFFFFFFFVFYKCLFVCYFKKIEKSFGKDFRMFHVTFTV